jgi:hypothetical protein
MLSLSLTRRTTAHRAAQTSSGAPSPPQAEKGSSATPDLSSSGGPDTPSPTVPAFSGERSSAGAVDADALTRALERIRFLETEAENMRAETERARSEAERERDELRRAMDRRSCTGCHIA